MRREHFVHLAPAAIRIGELFRALPDSGLERNSKCNTSTCYLWIDMVSSSGTQRKFYAKPAVLERVFCLVHLVIPAMLHRLCRRGSGATCQDPRRWVLGSFVEYYCGDSFVVWNMKRSERCQHNDKMNKIKIKQKKDRPTFGKRHDHICLHS
ncbi:uncharacterized protein BCR38DRAFT_62222 [Pseudomassariella vexata]|uniref:Uncharacterized protein n=1 Tax=Pseudomassariella vexata TaxID=1141098 RepID=A0A1Y2DKL8_9PEZI|nr:uncharacterized protein BCR38DRAFT_62222 [Pseudomassariella vexata]ORY59729.1 hypothetical protein BCR38DRAFT_62222 [Pseudomassariella vexata]